MQTVFAAIVRRPRRQTRIHQAASPGLVLDRQQLHPRTFDRIAALIQHATGDRGQMLHPNLYAFAGLRSGHGHGRSRAAYRQARKHGCAVYRRIAGSGGRDAERARGEVRKLEATVRLRADRAQRVGHVLRKQPHEGVRNPPVLVVDHLPTNRRRINLWMIVDRRPWPAAEDAKWLTARLITNHDDVDVPALFTEVDVHQPRIRQRRAGEICLLGRC